MSRESLVQAYIAALPFAPVAVVAIPGGGCRVAVGGEIAVGEKTARKFYFKASHVELLMARAGLTDAPIRQPAILVAELIEKTAAAIGAPYRSEAELRTAARKEVDRIVERIAAANAHGALKRWNRQYKQYRLVQIAKSEPVTPYKVFIERAVTMPMVRDVAASGRMI